MLVLTRKVGEKLLFPNIPMTLEVTECTPRSTSLGLDAPREVVILRDNAKGVESFKVGETITDELGRLRSLRNSSQAGFGTIHAMTERLLDLIQNGATKDEAVANLRTIQEAIITFENCYVNAPGCEIAVVDGRRNERELLGSILQMMGYRVRLLSTIPEALKYLKSPEPNPDALILDIEHHDCETCQKVAEAAGDETKVIVMCSETESCPCPEKIDARVEKPLNIMDVKEAIDTTTTDC